MRYRRDFDTTCMLYDWSLGRYSSAGLSNRVLAYHKLFFLTGGDERDVITATDPWRNYIYTNSKFYKDLSTNNTHQDMRLYSPDFRKEYPVKSGEVDEARVAISLFIQKVKDKKVDAGDLLGIYELPEVLSEIADVIYNIENVAFLDADFNYKSDIKSIADSLGYSLSEILYLAYLKYDFRIRQNEGRKDVPVENERIAQDLRTGRLPIPHIGQLSIAFGTINSIDNYIISARLVQLEYLIGREIREIRSKSPDGLQGDRYFI